MKKILVTTAITLAIVLGCNNSLVHADSVSAASTSVTTSTSTADTEEPVISGVKDITTYSGVKVDPLDGVTAKDNVDGNITKKIEVREVFESDVWIYHTDMIYTSHMSADDALFFFNRIGTHQLIYTVTDKAGNTATEMAELTVKLTQCDGKKNEYKYKYCNISSLTVHKDASTSSAKVDTASYGQFVFIVSKVRNSNWVRIILPNLNVGYVKGKYLSKVDSSYHSISFSKHRSALKKRLKDLGITMSKAKSGAKGIQIFIPGQFKTRKCSVPEWVEIQEERTISNGTRGLYPPGR